MLDVAAGTGNAAIPAAALGATVTASDLTPELFDAGRARAEAEGVELEWAQADAEDLPFEDASFDTVISSIGVMFAPHHQAAADEMVRVCRPGGTIGLLSWTPEGMLGALFGMMKPFMPPPPPGAQPPPLWGSEEHLQRALRRPGRVRDARTRRSSRSPPSSARTTTASTSSSATGRPSRHGRTPQREGREAEFDEALSSFCEEWNRGSADDARFEKEYLVAVGRRK